MKRRNLISVLVLAILFTLATVSSSYALKRKPTLTRAGVDDLVACMSKAILDPDNGSIQRIGGEIYCCNSDAETQKKTCTVCDKGNEGPPSYAETFTNCQNYTEKINIDDQSLKPKPGQDQLAPTKDKPRFPTKVWKFQKAPVTNAPTTDKPKKTRPSSTGTIMNTVPMKLFCQKGETKYQSAGHIPKGWTSRKVTLGNVTIYCAKPVKPHCKGGRLIMLKSMPPQWRCLCPQGWRKVRGKCTKNKPKTGPTINKNRIQ